MRGVGATLVVLLGISCVECGSSSRRSDSDGENEGGATTEGGSAGVQSTGGASGVQSTGGASGAGAGNGGSPTGGSSGASGTGGASGATNTGGSSGATNTGGTGGSSCEGAVELQVCAPNGQFCGSCTDVCSFCNVLVCQDGIWQRRETGPAPCFDCGDELRCQTGEAFCRIERGAMLVIECVPVPPECETNVDCACLGPLNPNHTCSGESGSVTLERCCG